NPRFVSFFSYLFLGLTISLLCASRGVTLRCGFHFLVPVTPLVLVDLSRIIRLDNNVAFQIFVILGKLHHNKLLKNGSPVKEWLARHRGTPDQPNPKKDQAAARS